jgi:diguanylate cyclase (GGDEF)-like protein
LDHFYSRINKLIGPDFSTKKIPLPEQRRAVLLSWMLISLCFLISTVLLLIAIVDPLTSSRSKGYIGLILVEFVLLSIAFALNRRGRYSIAAGLTIACAISGPWASVLFDPNILHGDLIPLLYLNVAILLSSFLLPSLVTIILAFTQMAGLVILRLLDPATAANNWPSLITLVFFNAALSILFNVLRKRDQTQIDNQTLQLIKNEEILRELSVRDYQTNLFNRRYLEETLKREIQRATRKHQPVGVIMIDIDHFKNYNDTFGHATGDFLLQRLGELLARQIRVDDIACRYGGDEFVLVLPDADLSVLQERAEELRKKVKQIQFSNEVIDMRSITISQGIAVFPRHGSTSEAILQAADAALYQAKKEGRDIVEVANSGE